MAISKGSNKRVYCDVSRDGSMKFMRKGRYPFMPATVSLTVSKLGQCDLLFVLESILTLFKKGYREPTVCTQNSIITTVIDWNACTFTLASKEYQEGLEIHILDICDVIAAVRQLN